MGWVKPYVLGDYAETVLRENGFFAMIRIKAKSKLMSYITKEQVVIVLKLEPQRKVIASADQEGPLLEQWEWIAQNITPTLSDDVNLRTEMLNFLESKFEIFADMEAQQKAKAEADALFIQTFQLEDEAMICYYSCSIYTSSKGLSPGFLYLTDHHLCYSSAVGKNTVIIPFNAIQSITKEKVLRMPNGIKIMVGKGDENAYLFTFFYRDETYDYITALLDIAMENIIRKEEGPVNSIAATFVSNEPNSPVKGAMTRRDITSPQNSHVDSIKDAESIKRHRDDANFQHLFHLPQMESVEKTYGVKRVKLASVTVAGQLYLSNNFFCFQSKDDVIQLTLPFAHIREMKLEVVQKASILRVVTPSTTLEFTLHNREAQECWEKVDVMHKVALFQHKGEDLSKYFEVQYDERIRELRSLGLSSPSLAKKSDEENRYDLAMRDLTSWKSWEDYYQEYGQGFSMIKTPHFYKLIHTTGVPDQLRGIMWQLCSGSTYLRFLLEGQNYYASLLKQAQDGETESVVADEIEKDLHRSLPEHTFYQSRAGIDSLRRVLLAYSVHNQEVGYCQAMNIVAALLLLYMSEESTFYLLCMLCEVYMPRTYSRAMVGAIIDQNVFEELLKEKLPDLYTFLTKKHVPVPAVTMGWFMCLFISFLPFQVTLRILDSFFVHGVSILYKAGLAIMTIYKPRLISQKDPYIVATMLKSSELDVTAEDLFLIMERDFGDLKNEYLEMRRTQAKYSYIRDIQNTGKNTEFSIILKSTQFTQIALDQLYSLYADVTKNEKSKSPLVNFKAFSKIMKSFQWWTSMTDYEKNKLFIRLTPRQALCVSFCEVATGLDPWIHGGLTSKFTSCFKLFDLDDDGKVTFEQLVRTFDLMFRLCLCSSNDIILPPSPTINISTANNNLTSSSSPSPSPSSSGTSTTPQPLDRSSPSDSIKIHSKTINADAFTNMIYDKIGLSLTQKASFSAVKMVAIDTPLFAGFFGIVAC